MKRCTMLVTAVMTACLFALPAHAKDAPVKLPAGAKTIKVDGFVHRVPKDSTHYVERTRFHVPGKTKVQRNVRYRPLKKGTTKLNGLEVPQGATHYFTEVVFGKHPDTTRWPGFADLIENPRPIELDPTGSGDDKDQDKPTGTTPTPTGTTPTPTGTKPTPTGTTPTPTGTTPTGTKPTPTGPNVSLPTPSGPNPGTPGSSVPTPTSPGPLTRPSPGGPMPLPTPGRVNLPLGEPPASSPRPTPITPTTSTTPVTPTTPNTPPANNANAPGSKLQFIHWPAQQRRSHQSPALQDIINHLPSSYGSTYYDRDPITYGHETTHGINSHLRNNKNDTGGRANGFYVMNDKGVIIPEPNIRKRHVAQFVPASLRESRFATYVTGSPSWDDTPTYLLDEWTAYVNGGVVGVDMHKRGLWNQGWRDGVMGQLEFTVYALALGQAVERFDPNGWKSNTQLREYLAWNSRRAMQVYHQGAQLPSFRWDKQDRYLQAMRTSPDAAGLRAWVKRTYGAQFAKDVFGF